MNFLAKLKLNCINKIFGLTVFDGGGLLVGFGYFDLFEVKIHSKRVGKLYVYTQNGWGSFKVTLETGGEVVNLHSKRGKKI